MTAYLLFLLAGAAASPPLPPLPPPSAASATRAELAAERAAIEQRFDADKQACERQFAITPCVEALRQRRHDALEPLVKREQALAAEERRIRAAAQAERVRERDLAAAQEEAQRREQAVVAPLPAVPATPASHAPRARDAADAARQRQRVEAQAAGVAAQRVEQRRVREDEQRKRIADHEARLQRRTKPAAAPLAVPGESAASAAR